MHSEIGKEAFAAKYPFLTEGLYKDEAAPPFIKSIFSDSIDNCILFVEKV
jgi:hypothetical protein